MWRKADTSPRPLRTRGRKVILWKREVGPSCWRLDGPTAHVGAELEGAMRAAITIAMLVGLIAPLQAQTRDSSNDIVGLWKAKRYFGPATRGPLLLHRTG